MIKYELSRRQPYIALTNQAVVRTRIVTKSAFLSLLAEAADIAFEPHTHQQILNVALRPPLASIALESSDKRHHPENNFVVQKNAGGEHLDVQDGYQQLSLPHFEGFVEWLRAMKARRI